MVLNDNPIQKDNMGKSNNLEFDKLEMGDVIELNKSCCVCLERHGYKIPVGTVGTVHLREIDETGTRGFDQIGIKFDLDEKEHKGFIEDLQSEPGWEECVIWWKSGKSEPWDGDESIHEIPVFDVYRFRRDVNGYPYLLDVTDEHVDASDSDMSEGVWKAFDRFTNSE